MLSRIVGRSLSRRRRRKLLGIAAVALGIAVTTAVSTLSLDVGDKVNRELRSFGANISVTPAADSLSVSVGGVDYRPAGSGAYLPESSLAQIKKIFWRNNIMAFAPYLDASARVGNRHVAVVGTWFEHNLVISKKEAFRTGIEQLHPSWRVRGAWPRSGQAECLVGSRLAKEIGARPGKPLTLSSASGTEAGLPLRVSGILSPTGEGPDLELLVPLSLLQKFTGLTGKIRRIEVSALTKPEDALARSNLAHLSAETFERWYCSPYAASIAYQIQQAVPGAQASPVYRVANTEGRVLHSIGLVMAILAIVSLLTAALAVASMMFATVLERKAEIGLFKSLGATDARVASIFMFEALAVGLIGGLAGYGLGSLIAWRLSVAVFGVPTAVHWVILPIVVALALVVSVAGSFVPVEQGLKISPAAVLRNE
jgi:putative ABC transport system permease protein